MSSTLICTDAAHSTPDSVTTDSVDGSGTSSVTSEDWVERSLGDFSGTTSLSQVSNGQDNDVDITDETSELDDEADQRSRLGVSEHADVDAEYDADMTDDWGSSIPFNFGDADHAKDCIAALRAGDNAHMRDDPSWRVVDWSEREPIVKREKNGLLAFQNEPKDVKIRKFYHVNLSRLDLRGDGRYHSLGLVMLVLRASPRASWATAYLERTFAVVANFRIFGNMQVGRFRSTLLVHAVENGEVVPYAVQPVFRDQTAELYADFSHPVDGFQYCLQLVMPRPTGDYRDLIHDTLQERLRGWIASEERKRVRALACAWNEERQKELEEARETLLRLEMETTLKGYFVSLEI